MSTKGRTRAFIVFCIPSFFFGSLSFNFGNYDRLCQLVASVTQSALYWRFKSMEAETDCPDPIAESQEGPVCLIAVSDKMTFV